MLELNKIPRLSEHLAEEVEAIEQHDHICFFYRDVAEELLAAAAFVQSGLKHKDKCAYVADDNKTSTVAAFLKKHTESADQALKDDELIITTKQNFYIHDGVFDPGKSIKFFAEAADQAKEEGFRGLRGTAEMTWHLAGDPGCERLFEYESRMNDELFPLHPAVGMCQYSLKRFSADVIREILFTHPKVIVGGLVCENLYYKPPKIYQPNQSTENADDEVLRMLEDIYNLASAA